MRLQRLTGLEQDKIVGEYKDVMAQIADLLDILATPSRVTTIIRRRAERQIKTEFGQTKLGARRSGDRAQRAGAGHRGPDHAPDMVVTLSHTGYIKSQALSEYRAQRAVARQAGHSDQRTTTGSTSSSSPTRTTGSCAFRNRGRVYWLKVWEVPQGNRNSRGKPIVNMFPLQAEEKITVVLPLTGEFRSFPKITSSSWPRRWAPSRRRRWTDFSNPRKAGIIAVDLDEGDYLIGAALTDGHHDVMLFSDGGKAVRFDEDDVRPMGRQARGVRGMMLEDGQRVIAMLVAEDESQSVLTATEKRLWQAHLIVEYTRHGRGTKGMIAIQQSERNGRVVAATLVRAEDEIMLITDKGVTAAKLSGLQRIVENDASDEEQDASPNLLRIDMNPAHIVWQHPTRRPVAGRCLQLLAWAADTPPSPSPGSARPN